jgi:hypothetical protein
LSVTISEQEQEEDPLSIFLYALKAPESKRQYPKRLKVFLDYLQLGGSLSQQAIEFLSKAKQNPQWAHNSLMKFISIQKQRADNGEISYSTIGNYYKAAKLFCEMNSNAPIVNWKKIARGIPTGRKAANDRSPTIEEILRLSEYPDRRIKPIVYVMSSSGIRLGAWDYLQWKHVTPITNDSGDIISAKLLIYPGDKEEYYCFITPEAYTAVKEWIDYRSQHGEIITENSWLMRDLWQTTEMNYGAKFGVAMYPKRLKSSGIKSLLERAIRSQGLCKPLPSGTNRREWKGAHGFRKFYKSRAEQVMRPINVEVTMGHDIGISASYYKPTEREVMEDYLKAVDTLTINSDRIVLQKQVTELKEKSKDSEYVIKGKLHEKDKQIEAMNEKYDLLQSQIQTIFSALSNADQSSKNELSKQLLQNGFFQRRQIEEEDK